MAKIIFILPLVSAFLLLLVSYTITAQNSEDYAFRIYSKKIDRNLKSHKNLALGVDFQVTNSYAIISKTYVAINGIHFRGIPNFKGYFPLNKNLSIDFSVPYIFTSQYSSKPGLLPGFIEEDVEFQNGLGDVSGGFKWWDRMTDNHKTSDIFGSLSLIVPVGKSTFQDTTEGFLARGGGFWTISFDGSFLRYFSKSVFISFDMSIQGRTITKADAILRESMTNALINADPVIAAGFGVGMPVMTNSTFGSNVSLSYTEIYLGNNYIKEGMQWEQYSGGFSLKRFGLRWAATEKVHSTFSIFIGGQYQTDYDKQKTLLSFLFDANIPLGYNSIGLKLY